LKIKLLGTTGVIGLGDLAIHAPEAAIDRLLIAMVRLLAHSAVKTNCCTEPETHHEDHDPPLFR
jgi:hypothetical protein